MRRVLIADMDGTIVDSMDFLKELAVALVAADGHSEKMMREVYDATFGKPIDEQFHIFNRSSCFAEPVNVVKLTKLYESVHALAARHFPFTEFGWSLFEYARRNEGRSDWKLVLVSSTRSDIVESMPRIKALPWTMCLGRSMEYATKHIQILHAIQQLGVGLCDCVYVGDAPSDKSLADDLGVPYYFPHPHTLSEILNAFPLAPLPEVHPGGESSRRA